jgi:phospholipid/cholesterol/gamma-HCH transport system permease protein
LAAWMIPELTRLGRSRGDEPRADEQRLAEAARLRGLAADAAALPSAGGMTAPRMAAAAVAACLLSLWGFAVGTLVGWQASGSLLGLSSKMFYMMFVQMIWFRDVVGLIVKGSLFGVFTAVICCFEGLRGWECQVGEAGIADRVEELSDHTAVATSVVRAACLSMVAILLVNMIWFIFVYHAVPVYGPSLLAPPSP